MGTFITVTRSSGSGMRDLPCAGDGNRPRFSCPRSSRPGSSRPGSQHQLLHAFATGQERRNKPESSAAKALLLTSSGAREQEREKEQEQESKRKNKNKKARARERKSKNKREKKNGKTPSLLRRIILRLGRITP